MSAIKGLYDGFIVGYKLSRTQNTAIVINTIKQAKLKEKVTDGLVLHSDQGYQYTSYTYYFSILRAECIKRVKLEIFDEAEILINDYIYYYNYKRINTKSKMTLYEIRSMAA